MTAPSIAGTVVGMALVEESPRAARSPIPELSDDEYAAMVDRAARGDADALNRLLNVAAK